MIADIETQTARVKEVRIEFVDPNILQPHPRNKAIYGNDEKMDDLYDKIAAGEKIEPLIVNQNYLIVSGHRRHRVVQKLKIAQVPIERRTYANEVEELEALLLANVQREKTTVQKVNEGQTWEYIEQEKAKVIQKAQGDIGREHGKNGGRPLKPPDANSTNNEKPLEEPVPQGVSPKPKSKTKERAPQTRDKVAAQVGLGSGKNYTNAKKAVNAAEALEERGKVDEAKVLLQALNKPGNIAAAAKIATMPAEKQEAVLSTIATGKAKNIKAAQVAVTKAENEAQAQAAPTKPRIVLASWEDWLPQQPQCDLLITDPPYSTDVKDIVSFANSWLPLALKKVKSTGRAYVCIGAYPQELQAYLSVQTSIPLQQILVWTYRNTIGPSPTFDYKQNWQAILYYRGSDAPPLDCPLLNEQFSSQEINAPDGRLGDRYHAWQKPDGLADSFIRHSTKKGDLVMDCFAGTGTFMLAAHKIGRIAAGCDQSPEMLEHAHKRGCEVVK